MLTAAEKADFTPPRSQVILVIKAGALPHHMAPLRSHFPRGAMMQSDPTTNTSQETRGVIRGLYIWTILYIVYIYLDYIFGQTQTCYLWSFLCSSVAKL